MIIQKIAKYKIKVEKTYKVEKSIEIIFEQNVQI